MKRVLAILLSMLLTNAFALAEGTPAAQVIVPADVALTVNGQTYTDCVLTAGSL